MTLVFITDQNSEVDSAGATVMDPVDVTVGPVLGPPLEVGDVDITIAVAIGHETEILMSDEAAVEIGRALLAQAGDVATVIFEAGTENQLQIIPGFYPMPIGTIIQLPDKRDVGVVGVTLRTDGPLTLRLDVGMVVCDPDMIAFVKRMETDPDYRARVDAELAKSEEAGHHMTP